MLGYGSFPYVNYKKEQIEWPVISLANQKHYVSVYVCALDEGKYLAEKYAAELGKVSVGKSCIRFKKLEDVHYDISVLQVMTLFEAYAANCGLEWHAGEVVQIRYDLLGERGLGIWSPVLSCMGARTF